MDGHFEIALQSDMLAGLLGFLQIPSCAVFGTSYGGEAALNLAIKYPEKVNKLLLANTVSKTNAWSREIGEAWNLAAGSPEAYYSTTIPVVYSPGFYDRKSDWMAKRKELLTQTAFANPQFLARMERLTKSAESHNVKARPHEIACPVLIPSSDQDPINPVEE